jgi:hypothetical protein
MHDIATELGTTVNPILDSGFGFRILDLLVLKSAIIRSLQLEENSDATRGQRCAGSCSLRRRPRVAGSPKSENTGIIQNQSYQDGLFCIDPWHRWLYQWGSISTAFRTVCRWKNPLYFCMTLQQLLIHRDSVLHEHPCLLMRVFLSTVAECESQTVAEKLNLCKQKTTLLTFGAIAPLVLKQYGLRLEDTSKAFAKQLAHYLDHMSRPINLDRAGPRITDKTANEHVSSVLRLVGWCHFTEML